MSTRQIHIFISHSWAHSDHYDRLTSWVFGRKWSVGSASLHFLDFSVPKDDPIHDAPNTAALMAAIRGQIGRCHVVVAPTGMYATHSKWIQREIQAARELSKPILAVNPWGQQRSASVVGGAAKQTVGWNKDSVIRGIWSLYREVAA